MFYFVAFNLIIKLKTVAKATQGKFNIYAGHQVRSKQQ